MALLRRRRTTDANPGVDVEYGPSLAKGPALIVGSILVVFGLTGLLTNADFPSASSAFPDGTANGSSWLGFEVNGWTNFFCIAAGALLMFGAAQHHLAKLMSLAVGVALGVGAVAAIIDGTDIFGLAAANGLTKLGLAVAAAVLLCNALMPRVKRERPVASQRTVAEEPGRVGPGEEPATAVMPGPSGTADARPAEAEEDGHARRGRFLRRDRTEEPSNAEAEIEAERARQVQRDRQAAASDRVTGPPQP